MAGAYAEKYRKMYKYFYSYKKRNRTLPGAAELDDHALRAYSLHDLPHLSRITRIHCVNCSCLQFI